jgi:hypothetical protein
MTRSAGLVLLATLTLTACASEPPDQKMVSSATYQTGYGDGCATSTARSKKFDRSIKRDETAYKEDEGYRRGWNAGYRNCGTAKTQSDPYSEPATGGDWKTRGPLDY